MPETIVKHQQSVDNEVQETVFISMKTNFSEVIRGKKNLILRGFYISD